MFDISFGELALCFVVALVVLGPEKLPKVARTVGRWAGQARGYATRILRQNPDYRASDFLDAFRFAPDAVAEYRRAAALVGFRS